MNESLEAENPPKLEPGKESPAPYCSLERRRDWFARVIESRVGKSVAHVGFGEKWGPIETVWVRFCGEATPIRAVVEIEDDIIREVYFPANDQGHLPAESDK